MNCSLSFSTNIITRTNSTEKEVFFFLIFSPEAKIRVLRLRFTKKSTNPTTNPQISLGFWIQKHERIINL